MKNTWKLEGKYEKYVETGGKTGKIHGTWMENMKNTWKLDGKFEKYMETGGKI